MLIAYAVVIVFALYVFVQFHAPTSRSHFAVEVAQAQSATIKQAIVADQAATTAAAASVQAGQVAAEAAAQASDIRTAAATATDKGDKGDKGEEREANRVLRDAEKAKKRAEHAEKRADIEQRRLEQKQRIEQAKLERLAIKRVTPEDKARITALEPDEQQGEKQVAESQQSLLQDQIAVKKSEIEVLRAQLVALDDVVDTVSPPAITTRVGRYFR